MHHTVYPFTPTCNVQNSATQVGSSDHAHYSTYNQMLPSQTLFFPSSACNTELQRNQTAQ